MGAERVVRAPRLEFVGYSPPNITVRAYLCTGWCVTMPTVLFTFTILSFYSAEGEVDVQRESFGYHTGYSVMSGVYSLVTRVFLERTRGYVWRLGQVRWGWLGYAVTA